MPSIKLKVIPKSGKRSVEPRDDGWRIYLKSLPEDGKANAELIRILAKFLKVTQSHISILKGHTSKNKTVDISGITSEELGEKLKKHV